MAFKIRASYYCTIKFSMARFLSFHSRLYPNPGGEFWSTKPTL